MTKNHEKTQELQQSAEIVKAAEEVIDTPVGSTGADTKPVEPQPVEEESSGIEGFEEDSLSLTSYPILTLAQALTPETSVEDSGIRAGMLMNSVTREPIGKSLEVIVYKMWRSLCKMPPRADGSFPLCYSVDRVQGSTNGKCAACPYMQSTKDRCKDQHYFVIAPADEPNNIMRMIMWKSSSPEGRKLSNILKAECSRHQRNIWGVTVNISSVQEESKQGAKYFVFKVSPGRVLTKEEEAELRPNYVLATSLRNKQVEDFYAYIEKAKELTENAPPDDDEFSKSLGDVSSPDDATVDPEAALM